MSPSRLVIGAAFVGGALLVWWFTAGSHFVALVDRVTTSPEGSSTSPTEFLFEEANDATSEPASFTFSRQRRIVGSDWHIVERPTGQASLETATGSVLLGAITRRSTETNGGHSYTFTPEPGDSVLVTRRRSRMSWPRPFVISWLGGKLPYWSRYAYDRLEWRKKNGAVLDVVWRDEQRLEPSSGWVDMYDPAPPATSLRGVAR